MTLIADLRALLRRPSAAAPGASSTLRRKQSAADLATEDEFVEALAQLDAEYDAARVVLENAGAERERLLVSGDDFAEIKKLAGDIDEAQFRLEAAERIRPELTRRLSQIRFTKRCARWIEVRDHAAAIAEKQLSAVAAYNAALATWRDVYDGVVADYPEAVAILPRMPGLYCEVPFETQIADFRTRILQRDAQPLPLMTTLAGAIEFARTTGIMPENLPSDWQLEVQRAMTGSARVTLLGQVIDADGRIIEKGTVLTLPYDDAAKYVTSGRAVYSS